MGPGAPKVTSLLAFFLTATYLTHEGDGLERTVL